MLTPPQETIHRIEKARMLKEYELLSDSYNMAQARLHEALLTIESLTNQVQGVLVAAEATNNEIARLRALLTANGIEP
jgi:hypothetical protein